MLPFSYCIYVLTCLWPCGQQHKWLVHLKISRYSNLTNLMYMYMYMALDVFLLESNSQRTSTVWSSKCITSALYVHSHQMSGHSKATADIMIDKSHLVLNRTHGLAMPLSSMATREGLVFGSLGTLSWDVWGLSKHQSEALSIILPLVHLSKLVHLDRWC